MWSFPFFFFFDNSNNRRCTSKHWRTTPSQKMLVPPNSGEFSSFFFFYFLFFYFFIFFYFFLPIQTISVRLSHTQKSNYGSWNSDFEILNKICKPNEVFGVWVCGKGFGSYSAIISKVFDEMSKLISPPPKLIILLCNNKAYPISIT